MLTGYAPARDAIADVIIFAKIKPHHGVGPFKCDRISRSYIFGGGLGLHLDWREGPFGQNRRNVLITQATLLQALLARFRLCKRLQHLESVFPPFSLVTLLARLSVVSKMAAICGGAFPEAPRFSQNAELARAIGAVKVIGASILA